MARIALTRAQSAEVRAVARHILTDQEPDMRRMESLLDRWGAEVPVGTDMSELGGADQRGMDMEQAVSRLHDAPADTFDLTFLSLMLEHQEAARSTLAAEQVSGGDPAAVRLASDMAAGRSDTTSQVQALLQESD